MSPMLRKMVMIVDDDRDLHRILAPRLLKSGYECASAYDVEEALCSIRELRPAVILLDIEFPHSSGFDFLRQLHNRWPDDLPLPPVIVLSGHNDESTIKSCLAMGAWGFVSKPFDETILLSLIEESSEGGDS